MPNTDDKTMLNNEIAFLSKKILDLNKKLMESEKTQSAFLSLVSSQLDDPVSALKQMIQTLQLKACKENEIAFSMIDNELFNMELKIKNLLMAVQIESGTIDIRYAPVKVSEIFDEVIQRSRYILKDKSLTVSMKNHCDGQILLDKKIVYMIIGNLFSNACLHSRHGSIIDVSLKKEDALLSVVVKNRGLPPGIEHKPEVFTRFNEDEHAVQGLGLGLSVVQGICERFDGSVDYTVDGEMVTFTAVCALNDEKSDSYVSGSKEFLIESFDDAIEI